MLDDQTQEKNRFAFYEFAKSVKKVDDTSEHVRMFDGYIDYRYNNGKNKILGKANIKLILRDYHSEGSIEIIGNEQFDADALHLGSSAAFQHYTFNEETKEFTIIGKSPKIGKYEININPI